MKLDRYRITHDIVELMKDDESNLQELIDYLFSHPEKLKNYVKKKKAEHAASYYL